MEATIIGIDLAKNNFQLCAVDSLGHLVWKKTLTRAALKKFIERQKRVVIAMEACGGAHYWGREFISMGFEVRLIAPQFVKPFVKSQKNDYHDALAICEAACRAQMRFSVVKNIREQEIQSLHRYRELLVSQRTMVINHSRGLLLEYGLVFPKGARNFISKVSHLLDNDLPSAVRAILNLLKEQLGELESKIKGCENGLRTISDNDPLVKQLEKVPGVGLITATALLTMSSHAHGLKNGRQFAASLGLVPRQNSSGGKVQLFGITKRGDGYLRKLLVHGARASLRWVDNKTDKTSLWAKEIKERRGYNIAAVALANKNARIIWAIMTKKEAFVWEYQQAA